MATEASVERLYKELISWLLEQMIFGTLEVSTINNKYSLRNQITDIF